MYHPLSNGNGLLTALCQGELEHRRLKRFYKRVHKGQHVSGITKQHLRERRVVKLNETAPKNTKARRQKRRYGALVDSDDETLPPTQPQQHYHMASSVWAKIHLSRWLGENHDDPALKVSTGYHPNSQRLYLLSGVSSLPQGTFTWACTWAEL